MALLQAEVAVILFEFGYARPDSLQSALALLARPGGDAQALAGGTDLLPRMRVGLATPSLLVSLRDVAPEPPRRTPEGGLRLDALARLADLAGSELVRHDAPMLVESVMAVGSNQVRQMGTLGGNLCQDTRCLYLDQKHDYQFVAPCYKRGGDCCYPFPNNKRDLCWAVHMSDLAPALIALDATLEIADESAVRSVAAADFFSGDGLRPLAIAPAELVRAIVIPPAGGACGWGFHKSTVRGGLEYAAAVMAVTLRLEADGRTCRSARVAIGAVRERPLRVASAEAALTGAALDDASLTNAAALASREVNPLPHHGASKRHLMDNIRVYLRRTLERARERAGWRAPD